MESFRAGTTRIKETASGSEEGAKREIAESGRRGDVCPLLRRWFNPPETCCPRDVLCSQYDEEPAHPRSCCIIHYEDVPSMGPEESQVTAFTPQRTKDPTAHFGRSYPQLSEEERLSVKARFPRGHHGNGPRRIPQILCGHPATFSPG